MSKDMIFKIAVKKQNNGQFFIQMQRMILVLLLLFVTTSVWAQNTGSIRGQIRDGETKILLEGASIKITSFKDNTKLSSLKSDAKGEFSLAQLPLNDSLLIEIDQMGYISFSGLMVLNSDQTVSMRVSISQKTTQLNEVKVKANRQLLTIKADTVEFNAMSFRTPPNSKAEDLMRKLPGLLIDNKGSLTFNGNPVTQILVDGVPFFGENGVVAMKNIPVDLIEKIQIHNLITAEEKLMGQVSAATGQSNKTLNIKLKTGNKYFGNGYAAAGTDKRYDLGALANYSKGKDRLSVHGGINNINKLEGRVGENSPTVGTEGGGIIRIPFAAVEYQGKEMKASYDFSSPKLVRESVTESRQQVLNDQSLTSNSNLRTNSLNISHLARFGIGGIPVRDGKGLSFSVVNESGTVVSNEETVIFEQDLQINRQSRNNESQGINRNYNLDAAYTFKLLPNIQLRLFSNLNFNGIKTEEINSISSTLYGMGQSVVPENITQLISTRNNLLSGHASASLIYPFRKTLTFLLFNGFKLSRTSNDRQSFKTDGFHLNPEPETDQTNLSRFRQLSNQTQFGLFGSYKKISINGKVSFRFNQRNLDDLSRQSNFKKSNFNVEPSLMLGYGKLSLNVSTKYGLPSLKQLQPVQNNTNPLFVRAGNPDLDPSMNYNSTLTYRKDKVKGSRTSNFSLSGNFNPISGKFVSYLKYDELGRQLSKDLNVNGVYSAGLNLNKGLSFRKDSTIWSAQLSADLNYLHDRIYVNTILNKINTLTIGPRLNGKYSCGSVLEIDATYSPSYKKLRYEQNATAGQNYLFHNLIGTLNLYLFQKLKWKQSVLYTYNTGLSNDLDRSSLLWNTQFSYLCLKNKAELKLTGFDLLNQNRNVSRVIANNYIEDKQSNNLQQYFMIGFAYNLSILKN